MVTAPWYCRPNGASGTTPHLQLRPSSHRLGPPRARHLRLRPARCRCLKGALRAEHKPTGHCNRGESARRQPTHRTIPSRPLRKSTGRRLTRVLSEWMRERTETEWRLCLTVSWPHAEYLRPVASVPWAFDAVLLGVVAESVEWAIVLFAAAWVLSGACHGGASVASQHEGLDVHDRRLAVWLEGPLRGQRQPFVVLKQGPAGWR